MASRNIPPDPTATFDSLWDIDEPEPEPIPAALAPPRPVKVAPELRGTMPPPVPAPEYVQTMMELGELDDPSAGAVVPRAAQQARAGASPAAPPAGEAPMGLVLAAESELILQAGAPIAGAAVQARGPVAGGPAPGRISGLTRPSATQAPVARGAPVITGAPSPRAPSIPPPPPSVRAQQELDLMPFEELVKEQTSAPASGVAPTLKGVAPQTRTPTPPSNGPPPPLAKSGGLRLGKSPPSMPAVEADDRVTPLQSEAAPDSAVDQVRAMQARFEARNYPGALVLAESILVGHPGNAVAKRCAESCRDMLAQKYLSRIGGRNCVPRLVMPPEEVSRLALDHRAGFLLSFIDGAMSVDEVLDVSSMAELDALRIMFELQEQGAIAIEAPARRPGRK